MDDLHKKARLWGIAADYYDGLGKRHIAGGETLAQLIDAIAEDCANPPAFNPAANAAERCAFQGDGRRLWGMTVQLYALRSRRNWGHGDFTDLKNLIVLAAAHGASAIGLNPLHALFADRAEDASPYAPNSRLFLNPLYIDVEAIAEFPGIEAAGLADEIAALRAGDMIDYPRVARAKLAALRIAHERFRVAASAERRADFSLYRDQHNETLLRFSCFEELRRRYAPDPWPQWPQEWRRPDRARLLAFHNEHAVACEFHEFVQWIAERQLAACQETARLNGMPIGLYTDLAVGIDRHGADAWIQQHVVLETVSIGAPPDEFNPGGQDWGLAPFNPQALPAHDFFAMRRLMDVIMRHAGAVRLDHVFGLQRLFLFPLGTPASQGTYVRFPFEPLLRVITEESNRFRSIVIGEDLGTVPDNFRETTSRYGLWGCRVMLFEREEDGRFRPPADYPAEALASFNTHDMASFRGWVEGYDLRLKHAIGVDPGESEAARAQSQAMLRETLAQWAPDYAPDDIAAVAAFLGATPSRLAVIALDDVLGVQDQINMPGTTDQHPNWRRRLPVAIEDIDGHEGLARVAQAFAQTGRSFSG
jgi:4-alpha-glucanotransferase